MDSIESVDFICANLNLYITIIIQAIYNSIYNLVLVKNDYSI